jgi:hypothetical protein
VDKTWLKADSATNHWKGKDHRAIRYGYERQPDGWLELDTLSGVRPKWVWAGMDEEEAGGCEDDAAPFESASTAVR